MRTMRRAAVVTLAGAWPRRRHGCGDDEDGDGGTTDEEIQEGEDRVDDVGDEIQEEVDAQDEGSNDDGRSQPAWNSAAWSRLRQAHHRDEELVDLADHLDEPLEVDRLGDVGVGVQVVAAQDVLLGLGRGEHHHRDAAQVVVGLDLGQHLPPVAAGAG